MNEERRLTLTHLQKKCLRKCTFKSHKHHLVLSGVQTGASQAGASGKNLPVPGDIRDGFQSLGQVASLEEGESLPLAFLPGSTDREGWRAAVHGVIKSGATGADLAPQVQIRGQ